VQEILDGKFEGELKSLMELSTEELKDLYKKREIEPA
jgi:hypothetical protein